MKKSRNYILYIFILLPLAWCTQNVANHPNDLIETRAVLTQFSDNYYQGELFACLSSIKDLENINCSKNSLLITNLSIFDAVVCSKLKNLSFSGTIAVDNVPILNLLSLIDELLTSTICTKLISLQSTLTNISDQLSSLTILNNFSDLLITLTADVGLSISISDLFDTSTLSDAMLCSKIELVQSTLNTTTNQLVSVQDIISTLTLENILSFADIFDTVTGGNVILCSKLISLQSTLTNISDQLSSLTILNNFSDLLITLTADVGLSISISDLFDTSTLSDSMLCSKIELVQSTLNTVTSQITLLEDNLLTLSVGIFTELLNLSVQLTLIQDAIALLI